MAKVKKIKVVSLFSGAGGLDLGLIKAGLQVVWANDNDKDSVETYKKNVDKNIVLSDICNVKSKEIPDCDLVVGGFPCQGFSVANKFRSSKDERNTLYLEMLRVIKDKKPKWFIAENVKGLLNIDNGRVFEMILNDFEMAGYSVCYQLVNMADHGIPQMRKRVVILGTRKDLPEELKFIHPKPTHSDKDGNLKKWVSVQIALGELAQFGKELKNNVGSKYKVVYRNFTGHRKTNGDKPCPTIIARGNAKGGVCAIPHPTEDRRLTVRESAWIQTFPVDFEFIGAVNSMYRQIGNAVPVSYGERLGKQLKKLVNSYD